jgi:hypothetical protein
VGEHAQGPLIVNLTGTRYGVGHGFQIDGTFVGQREEQIVRLASPTESAGAAGETRGHAGLRLRQWMPGGSRWANIIGSQWVQTPRHGDPITGRLRHRHTWGRRWAHLLAALMVAEDEVDPLVQMGRHVLGLQRRPVLCNEVCAPTAAAPACQPTARTHGAQPTAPRAGRRLIRTGGGRWLHRQTAWGGGCACGYSYRRGRWPMAAARHHPAEPLPAAAPAEGWIRCAGTRGRRRTRA